jgi:RNAse (barnase) inhibitor barstar
MRWLLVDEHTMGAPDTTVAACADIDGLFVDAASALPADGPADPQDRSQAPFQPARLQGCRPAPALHRALMALARGAGNPGGALHRRWINTSILSVALDGTATATGAHLQASVTGAHPSTLGGGLLDVTFDDAIADPLPTEARRIWELWRAGHPSEQGHWVSYGPAGRRHWVAAAAAHHHKTADRPAGTTYHLDGRAVTNIEGFYCAFGEAINGPGGYFGSNADAVHDCLRGGFGATRPFRLVWRDFAVARTHLVTVNQLLHRLAEDDIEVELR